jgi:hypothetical protein
MTRKSRKKSELSPIKIKKPLKPNANILDSITNTLEDSPQITHKFKHTKSSLQLGINFVLGK